MLHDSSTFNQAFQLNCFDRGYSGDIDPPNLDLNFKVWKHVIPAHVDPLISENGAKT
jgi:hypothetical protein